MQKITPFLWFDTQAEEAARFYVDVFNGNPAKKIESKMGDDSLYKEANEEISGKPKGSVMVASFELEGQEYTALNGGPHFTFSGAISFVINCKTQEEVDYFWQKLGEGGQTGQCGWINKDKFGVTWQVVPEALGDFIGGSDEEGAERAMQAMLKMTKLDIEGLKNAYEGR